MILIMANEKIKIVVSIILGLGIATLFRKVCNHRNCIIIKGPEKKEVESNTYKFKGKCYKYISEKTQCN